MYDLAVCTDDQAAEVTRAPGRLGGQVHDEPIDDGGEIEIVTALGLAQEVSVEAIRSGSDVVCDVVEFAEAGLAPVEGSSVPQALKSSHADVEDTVAAALPLQRCPQQFVELARRRRCIAGNPAIQQTRLVLAIEDRTEANDLVVYDCLGSTRVGQIVGGSVDAECDTIASWLLVSARGGISPVVKIGDASVRVFGTDHRAVLIPLCVSAAFRPRGSRRAPRR